MEQLNTYRAQIKGLNVSETLKWVIETFPNQWTFANSMGAEDQVIHDMLCKLTPSPDIFTLDTGRLPYETYDCLAKTNQKYGIPIKVMFPDQSETEQMVNKFGPNLFYESIENRKLCCTVRKINPLKRALNGKGIWICGLRQAQNITRADMELLDWDENFKLYKLNPLITWSSQEVWDYIHAHEVPFNALHSSHYPSIGCAPCTRPVKEGEDERSGRWWWEKPESKECGLHWKDGKLVRKGS